MAIRRASGRPTSECMREFFKVRFEGHRKSEAVQQDVLFWLSYLAGHKSVPKKHRITTSVLLRYFETGTIACPYYVFLIRAALDHYYNVLEVNQLPVCVKFLAMHILEDREVITLRGAAKHLKMTPYQLVQILNGHAPIDQQTELAIQDLVREVSANADTIINESLLPDEVDYLDYVPGDTEYYLDEEEELDDESERDSDDDLDSDFKD